jgi:hypothetical protein
MKHLQPFQARQVLALPTAQAGGWTLKRYAILSEGRNFDDKIADAALQAAIARLPAAGDIQDAATNHGVGFQIIHFAEIAVVAPAFYWQWGSVLANAAQIRAPWDKPTEFGIGKDEVVGCVWEMDIVNFEVSAWKATVLGEGGPAQARVLQYLGQHYLT